MSKTPLSVKIPSGSHTDKMSVYTASERNTISINIVGENYNDTLRHELNARIRNLADANHALACKRAEGVTTYSVTEPLHSAIDTAESMLINALTDLVHSMRLSKLNVGQVTRENTRIRF